MELDATTGIGSCCHEPTAQSGTSGPSSYCPSCHDFNEGYWSHLWRSQSLFFGRLAATGDLLFMPGDEGDNDYGSAPWI